MAESTPLSTPETTVAILGALADPARWYAYEVLRALGEMRGVEVARHVGVSEASMSKHLRQLRDIGFVVELDTERHRRLHRWRAVPGGVHVELDADEIEGEYGDALSAWLRVELLVQMRMLQRWVEVSPGWPYEWRDSWHSDERILRLTAAECKELSDDLAALAEKWVGVAGDRTPETSENTEAVLLVTHAIPVPHER